MNLAEIGVTGPRGRIGSALVKRGMTPLFFDVTSDVGLMKAQTPPHVKKIIHCAAFTDVNLAEEPERFETVLQINMWGTARVSELIGEGNMLFLSTDHVFAGDGVAKEGDKLGPLNVYGMTKLSAEAIVELDHSRIVRTSHVFDSPASFPVFDGEPHEVPSFIRKSFMYAEDFADCLVYYVKHWNEMPSVLHIAGTETEDWFHFIQECAKATGYPAWKITERDIEQDGFAPRPMDSGLDVTLAKSLGLPVVTYREGLSRWKKSLFAF